MLAILVDYVYGVVIMEIKFGRFMKTLSVEEIKDHLTRGASEEDLMRDYGLSSEELKALYDQLIRAVAEGSLYIEVGSQEK